jgi:NDP-sugar pyrophosphorylase family protein
MRAVILAGGLGMRLRPYTTVLPKPLMPVGDRPVLDIIVRQLKSAGCERITISTGYLAELIEAFFGAGDKYGVHIDYFRESEPLGTVGSLALIDDFVDDALVMNGDILTDLDYARMLAEHRATDAVATIATSVREVEITLGVPQFGHDDDKTRITGFVEKPRIDYQASMGVFCLSPRAVSYIDPGEHLDLPELVLRLVERGEVARAWPSNDYWLDMGQHDDYEQALAEFERYRDRLLPEQ